jgi:hypothetical protein
LPSTYHKLFTKIIANFLDTVSCLRHNGDRHWNTLTNCADCEAELCSECGVEQGEDERSAEMWLCRTCARKRATTRAEEAVALEVEQRDSDPSNLWDDSGENLLETSEFRQAPQRAERTQINHQFDREVA